MQFIEITGTVTSHGISTTDSDKNGEVAEHTPTKYQYISFREDKTGKDIQTGKTEVAGIVNRYISPDVHGTFIIAKMMKGRRIIGFRNDESEAVDPWVLKPTGVYLGPLILIGVGLVLSVTMILAIIGVPILLLGLWLLFTLPKWPSEMRAALQKNGFDIGSIKKI